MAAPELSVVVPMYNEAAVVGATLEALGAELESCGLSFEILCVDDGSDDETADRLHALADADVRIVPIRLSRNFGKEAAVFAGLSAARGAGVVLLDADGQHPPDLLPTLVARWREGYDVVEAVKASRGNEGWLYRKAAGLFNGLMEEFTGLDWSGASDYKLLDRQVVDAVLACGERNRFFRGLVAWVGFRVIEVPFEVRERVGGTTKWRPFALLAYSLRNLVAFSSVPLRAISWIGFLTVLAGAGLALQTLYNYWTGVAVTGFTTVILLIYWLSGLILLSLGVLGIYVSQLYEEQKGRPVFIVRKPREASTTED